MRGKTWPIAPSKWFDDTVRRGQRVEMLQTCYLAQQPLTPELPSHLFEMENLSADMRRALTQTFAPNLNPISVAHGGKRIRSEVHKAGWKNGINIAIAASMDRLPNIRFTLLPLALLQLMAGYLPRALGVGQDIGTRMTRDGIPPELPPGPFFAIWGLIFLAYFGFALHAAGRNDELTRQLSAPLALAGLCNFIWMISAQTIGSTLLETLILLPLLRAAWTGAWRFDRMRGMGGSAVKWTGDLLTGLLAGWSAVALAISIPRLARESLGQGPTDSEWISFWLVIATVSIAAWIFRIRVSRTLWFHAALSWGLLGILVNNWTRTGFGYFGWITLMFGCWIIARRFMRGAEGARRGTAT